MAPRTLARAILTWLACGALVAVPFAPARAQPSLQALREEIARLRQAPPEGVPPGTLTSIEYLLDVSERIERDFAPQAQAWRATAERHLAAVREGRDPYVEARGRISNRGYDSPLSQIRQGYAIYVPPDYDPARRYPMLVMLHGGSSNGNLFLGVVLGNNLDWETYSQHLWDAYTPRWFPDWIVVAPDGFGQVLWRWMGERDVLDVIDDVQRHYSVDPDRIVLGGLSNGGLGAYAIGMRHAWRFSMVLAIAGAPSWVQYTGGAPSDEERRVLETHSAMHLVENSLDTDFRFFHGTRDPGPMRPAYVREMEAHMRSLGIEPRVRWFDFGHDLLYLVHRHGRAYADWAQVVRNPRPAEVRIVSGDYRASRQHWLTLTRIDDYPRLARARARATASEIVIETERVLELAIDLRLVPVGQGDLRIVVDGTEAYRGPRAPLGHVLHLAREGGQPRGTWRCGFLPPPAGLEKVPGLSGPLTDPYHDGMIHVYGTQDPAAVEALRAAARRGARGWPLWLWNFQQRVVADTEVTDAMMQRSHVVLYGTPGANAVLERMWDRLPIRVGRDGVHVGARTFRNPGVGTRFVYPNPLAPRRYVIVQAAPTTGAVASGNDLPDWLPDWVVYDARSTRTRPRLVSGRNGQVAMGFFDRFWRLPEALASAHDVRARMRVLGGDEAAVLLAQLDAGTGAGGEGSLADVPAGSVAATDSDALRGPVGSGPPEETPEQRRRRLEMNARIGAPPDFVIPAAVLQQTPPPELPPGEVPPTPPRPRRFAAPEDDPAGRIARILARRVSSFYNYRALVGGGVWRVDPAARWQIQPQARCHAALEAAGVPFQPVPDLPTPVPSPVAITGPVGGVELRMLRPEDGPLTLSCEMAARLPVLAEVARRHSIRAIVVLSAYRPTPLQSFHRFGLALDLFAFETDDGRMLRVYDDFVETPAHRTCEAPPPPGRAARTLLRLACDLAQTGHFSSVLTPNYNDGHRNHFHLDARPDDPRIFVR